MVQQDQIGILAVCYSMLFLLCLWAWKMKSENLISQKVVNGNWLLLHIRHAGGILIMTGLPASFLQVVPASIFLWPGSVDHIKTVALIVTSSILVILAINEREDLSREKPLSRDGLSFHVMLHIALRSSFLVSYECFFRGCVLFSCIEFFGTAPAIIINLILYALIHSFNGKKEMYGAIPFGLMLCLFTIWYQSVWPAILLHLLLTSLHESFILSSLFCKKSTPVL